MLNLIAFQKRFPVVVGLCLALIRALILPFSLGGWGRFCVFDCINVDLDDKHHPPPFGNLKNGQRIRIRGRGVAQYA